MAFQYPDQYYQFFTKFNQGEFYECHDLLEEIWMEERANKFLQGLLQMAVALYHFRNGNIKGARSLFTSARRYLQPYRPRYWDVDLELVNTYITECLHVLPEQEKISLEEIKKVPLPTLVLYLEDGSSGEKSKILRTFSP